MELHIIRHGKTMANEQRLYCGQTDLPLSDNGTAELVKLKNQGIYPKSASLYITSGLLRTQQTLRLLYGSVQSEIIPQLMEYQFGSFEMKSHDQLDGQADYQAWIDDAVGHFACPGGESKQDFNLRADEGSKLLLSKAQQGVSVLAVLHGGVIAFIMEHLFPDKYNFYEWQPAPGRGYSLTCAPDGSMQFLKI